jgi:hypothetical protein
VAGTSVVAATALIAVLVASAWPVDRPPGDPAASPSRSAPPFADAPEAVAVGGCPAGDGPPVRRVARAVARIEVPRMTPASRWLTYQPASRTLLMPGAERDVMTSVGLFGGHAGSWAMPTDAAVLAAVGHTPDGPALATIADPSLLALAPLPHDDPSVVPDGDRVDLRGLDLDEIRAADVRGADIALVDAGHRLVRARMGADGLGSACEVRARPGETFRAVATRRGDGHTFVVAAGARGTRLVELGPQGAPLADFVLPRPLGRVAAMTFAPSADPYDEVTTEHLYLLTSARSRPVIRVVALEPMEITVAADVVVRPRLVRAASTTEWDPPSADPTGAAYDAARGMLIVTDSETDELFPNEPTNVWVATTDGALREVLAFPPSVELTDVAIDPSRPRYFIADDSEKVIHVWEPAADEVLGTSDDRTYRIATDAFGSLDPEGLAFGQGSLFVADGAGRRVYRVMPGPNGTFDGVHDRSDDEVDSFDVAGLGLLDPEGIAYDPRHGTLLILDRDDAGPVLEVTTTGRLVRRYDLTGLGLRSPAGLALGPSSDDPERRSLFIVDRGVDNAVDPRELDGQLVELRLPEP